jgi:hypothetical protein
LPIVNVSIENIQITPTAIPSEEAVLSLPINHN